MVFNFLLRYYLVLPQFKVIILWFGILLLSATRLFMDAPETIFGSKNFFNTYFVKWSWGWTSIVITPYMVLMAGVYSCEHWKRGISAALTRLAIATALWYFWAAVVFHWIENLTGICLDSRLNPLLNVMDKQSCLRLEGKHRWEGFDISGHAFLLTYISLIISSELQVHRYWHYIPNHAARFLPIGSRALLRLKARHKTTETVAKWFFVVNCVLSILWELSLVITCLYFHDFFSKAIGAAAGIFSWMVTYSELYGSKYLPIFPGHGPINSLLAPRRTKSEENEDKNS